MIKKHLDMLGRKRTDKVTGISGVVTSISFDLYGCIQVIITPKIKEDGTLPDSRWMDVSRIEIDSEPVIKQPDFNKGYVAEGFKGAAIKPLM